MKDKITRVDRDFVKDLENASIERIKNGNERRTLPTRELTRMLRNTQGWNSVLQELKLKPRRAT